MIAKARLPERYYMPWKESFDARFGLSLKPSIRILDVGSGCKPTLEPPRRPPGSLYVGLDISAAELEKAPEGSYDEKWVGDINDHMPQLVERFDLIVSWHVLEHVRSLQNALENVHSHLVPGGRFIAMRSGRSSLFGIINSLVPTNFGLWAMHRLLGRDPNTVFPAHYDRCWSGALREMLSPWQSFEIVPHYRGAVYLGFSPILQRIYLLYENWAHRGEHGNLATHYVIDAVR
jgi:SAM-dependent methyltransferase